MSEAPGPPPSKRDLARALLVRGCVFVHLDPRGEAVQVPKWLKAQPQLVLQLGLDMPVLIPDLRISDAGIYATLSFQRAPFACEVPWSAVFAMLGDDGKGMVWPEDMPAEIAEEVERETSRRGRTQLRQPNASTLHPSSDEPASQSAGQPAAGRPAPSTLPAPSSTSSAGRVAKASRQLPPYLRVIK